MIHTINKDEKISKSVGIGATVNFKSIQVPSRSKLILKKFGNDVDTNAAWGSIIWMVKRNGLGVYPYDSIKDRLGDPALPTEIYPGEFSGADKLDIEVKNDYSAACVVGVRIVYDIEEGESF